jgi:hypothetical protein
LRGSKTYDSPEVVLAICVHRRDLNVALENIGPLLMLIDNAVNTDAVLHVAHLAYLGSVVPVKLTNSPNFKAHINTGHFVRDWHDFL